jgi:hypothetical protein
VVADGPLDELRLAGGERVGDVLEAAGAEIVEDENLVAARDQRVSQMRADEALPEAGAA